MANKANNSYGGLNCVNLLEWAIQQTQSGPFVIDPAITTEGLPVRGLWYAGHLDVGAVGGSWALTLRGNKVTYVNGTSRGVWTGWDSYYAATPPQEYDLPLAEGVSVLRYGAKYAKTQEGFVKLRIDCLAKSDDTNFTQEGAQVATLPAGYRPADRLQLFCLYGDGYYFTGSGTLDILSSGAIEMWQVQNMSTGIKTIYCTGEFPCAAL